MNKINDGGPAYPVSDLAGVGIQAMRLNPTTGAPAWAGMTLRDYFAAKVVQQYLAENFAEFRQDGSSTGWTDAEMARFSYEMADAMLAARDTAGNAD